MCYSLESAQSSVWHISTVRWFQRKCKLQTGVHPQMVSSLIVVLVKMCSCQQAHSVLWSSCCSSIVVELANLSRGVQNLISLKVVLIRILLCWHPEGSLSTVPIYTATHVGSLQHISQTPGHLSASSPVSFTSRVSMQSLVCVSTTSTQTLLYHP